MGLIVVRSSQKRAPGGRVGAARCARAFLTTVQSAGAERGARASSPASRRDGKWCQAARLEARRTRSRPQRN